MTTTEATQTLFVAPSSGESLRVMGDLITFKLRARDTGGAFTLFEGVVAPGGAEPIHLHEREDEIFYVLAGQIAFLIGGEWREAPVGSVTYVPRGTVHGFRNTGESEARLLTLNVPGGLHEELFAAMSQLPPPASPEDGAALIALASRYGTQILPPPGA
jgi:mannose-6-phosphate isomerase-like protein (cupin superfamily)